MEGFSDWTASSKKKGHYDFRVSNLQSLSLPRRNSVPLVKKKVDSRGRTRIATWPNKQLVPYSNWIQSFPFGGKFISMIAGVVSLPCICNLSLVSLVLLKEVLHIPETLVKQSLSWWLWKTNAQKMTSITMHTPMGMTWVHWMTCCGVVVELGGENFKLVPLIGVWVEMKQMVSR